MSIDHKEIMQQVKENSKKLSECSFHEFSIDTTPNKQFDKRYRCIRCEGEVSASSKYWYDKGREQCIKALEIVKVLLGF